MTFLDKLNECMNVCAGGAVEDCVKCTRQLLWAAKIYLPALLQGEVVKRLANAVTLKETWSGVRAIDVADIAQFELLDNTSSPPAPIVRLATGSYEGITALARDLVSVGVTGGELRYLGVRCNGNPLVLERGADYDLVLQVSDESPVIPDTFEPSTVMCAYGTCYQVYAYKQPTWVSGGGEVSVMIGVFKLAGAQEFLAGEGVAILNYYCNECVARELKLRQGEAIVLTNTFTVRGPFVIITGP